MDFSFLEDAHQTWQDICVIGKTIERAEGNCHIVGMTLTDQVNLYIIEPYDRAKDTDRPGRGIRTQRRTLREDREERFSYLHCSEFRFGNKNLQVQGGSGEPLGYAEHNQRTIQLFMDMISAGWQIPAWLKDTEWDDLMLITLTMTGDVKKLPGYSPDMPVTICHGISWTRHILEKTVTLQVGKSRSFSFTDHEGDVVRCYVNNVLLIDVWADMEKQWSDPKIAEKFSPEQLQQARKFSQDALEQNVPKGMCYIGVEYECTKDINLSFYTKQFLGSRPETRRGSSSMLMVRMKPDRETGTHHLPLRGCMIQTPVAPDTTIVPAEAFFYMKKIDKWTETV